MPKKTYIEYALVRDYGKQGLAVFDMTSPANPGRICCWSTILSYDDRPKGFRPDADAPYSYDEVPMDYYFKGRLVRPDTSLWRGLGAERIMKRYHHFSRNAYPLDVKLDIVVVQRDQERFRAERWKR